MQAELICDQVLSKNPEDPEALKLLGMIYYKLNQGKVVPADAALDYHLWYYNSRIWLKTSWAGVRTLKSPSDMWNYQEIITELKPNLIIEFGTCHGGSALFFSSVIKQINPKGKVFSVDVNSEFINSLAKEDPLIELMEASSTSREVAIRISELRKEYPGPVFAILDSDHNKDHVLQEMLLLRHLLHPGDYLIVEDSNINGHPVLPGWGEGPYEAVQEYFSLYPNDYEVDSSREQKFGFSFATGGFLIRKAA
ncbi:MAG: CmcI family methyltransferase [Trichodesmium sp.]